MEDVQELVTYGEAMSGNKKNVWKLVVKGELDSIERNSHSSETVLPVGKYAIPCTVVMNLELDVQGRIAHHKAPFSQRSTTKRTVLTTARSSSQS